MLDYADLLYTKNGKEKRDRLDDIYTSLRGMATELKIPIWTASQSNRSAARDNIIQGDQIAESYSKIMISDFALSLSRKTEDKEKTCFFFFFFFFYIVTDIQFWSSVENKRLEVG